MLLYTYNTKQCLVIFITFYLLLYWYYFLISANSITQAHDCFDKLQLDNNQPVLVGGKKRVVLNTEQLTEHDIDLCFNDQEVVATSFRSLLVYTKTNNTCRGILYRLREHKRRASYQDH